MRKPLQQIVPVAEPQSQALDLIKFAAGAGLIYYTYRTYTSTNWTPSAYSYELLKNVSTLASWAIGINLMEDGLNGLTHQSHSKNWKQKAAYTTMCTAPLGVILCLTYLKDSADLPR
jgi:hypothetical protein